MTDEEAIKRLKQIKKDNDEIVEESKNLVTGELKVSLTNDSIAIETVLNLIEKQKEEIKALNQVHKYDVNMIDEVKGEAVKLYKIIDLMAKYIEEQTESCPLDMFNYKEIYCENVCKKETYHCWIEYFKRKVEDK